MTESEDWTPDLGPPSGDQYKWGLNGDTGELTIWEVSGPGDGFPSHDTYLATAWGRRPRYDGRDSSAPRSCGTPMFSSSPTRRPSSAETDSLG